MKHHYVYDDRYVFMYNFHGGTETIPREAVEEAFGSDLTRLAPGFLFCAEEEKTEWTGIQRGAMEWMQKIYAGSR